MTNRIRYSSGSARSVEGELAVPVGDGAAPGLVLIQEWWGVNDNIRAYADRYASEGFLTLAVDLYDGSVALNADEASHRMDGLDWNRALDHIEGALALLRAHSRSNGRVGVTGFCMGGALTLAAANQLRGIQAAVPFYGIPGAFDASAVEAPILGHFSSSDTWATPEKIQAIEASLRGFERDVRIVYYEADHAFMNMSRPEVYNASCAANAWAETVSFLRQHLSA